MKTRTLFTVVAIAAVWSAILVCFSGCASLSTDLQTEALDVGPIVERHDHEVARDEAMSQSARNLAFGESRTLLTLLETREQITETEFGASLRPVVDRYDYYLDRAWEAGELSEFQKRYLSRTSQLARELGGLPPYVYAWE